MAQARRGYVPDGTGISRQGIVPAWGDTIRVDDDLVLWLVKDLRGATPSGGLDATVRVCTGDDLPVLRQFYANLFTEVGDPVGEEGVDGRLSEYALIAEANANPIGYILAAVETIEFMQSEIGRAAFPGEKWQLLHVGPAHHSTTPFVSMA